MNRLILTVLSLALVVPPAALVTAAPSFAAAKTCWTVVDAADGAKDGPEMETLCVDANLAASFGEPISYFGDVSKCGTVALSGDKNMGFTVNLSACDGDLPNHRIACEPLQAGQAHCTLTWADGSEDRPVMLMPTNG